jgi:hypothetical protein
MRGAPRTTAGRARPRRCRPARDGRPRSVAAPARRVVRAAARRGHRDSAQGGPAVRGPGRDGDHSTAGRELPLEHRLRLRGDVRATVQQRLRCALDDDLTLTVGGLDEHRGQTSLVVEGSCRDPPGAIDAGSARGFPERAVELVTADHPPLGERGVVAQQTCPEHRVRQPPGGIQRGAEGDCALGQLVLAAIAAEVRPRTRGTVQSQRTPSARRCRRCCPRPAQGSARRGPCTSPTHGPRGGRRSRPHER